jgi:hypothetical protein
MRTRMLKLVGPTLRVADIAAVTFALVATAGAVTVLHEAEPGPALGFLLALVPPLPLAVRWATAPKEEVGTVADCATMPRRLILSIWTLGFLAISMVFGVSWLLEAHALSPALRLLVALVPVPVFTGFIVSEIQVLRRLDELQKRIQLEALAIAFPAGIILAIAVEYLQKAGFLTEWTFGDVWPYMALLYLPAYLIARGRYR